MDLNFASHKFSNEAKTDLLNFLKIANENKASNKFCDLSKHQIWSKLFPLDSDLEQALDKSTEVQCIEIYDSDDEEIEISKEVVENEVELSLRLSGAVVDDIIYAIKENLETQKALSDTVLKDLKASSNQKLEKTFSSLSEDVNSEEVVNFGTSIEKIDSDLIVSHYVKTLLLKTIQTEYSDKLQDILKKYSKSDKNIVVTSLTTILLKDTLNNSKVLFQFVSNLDLEFKAALFKEFIQNCQVLNESNVTVLDILLNELVDYNSINQLIKLMAASADEFSSSKSYGKLLMTAVQFLGKNILLLEQPLKLIIGRHKSIWKIKIQKLFTACLEENMILSQSFRC